MSRERRDDDEIRIEHTDEAGRKGGAASMAAGAPYYGSRTAAAFWTRDLVRWGPIWAGLLLAIAIQLVLGAIGLAIALGAYDPAAADYGTRVANTLSVWTAISALIALFIGGFIAGRMASVLGLRNGLAQGSVVWALALLFGIILSSVGVAGVLGSVPNINALIAQGFNVTAAEARQLAATATTATWWFVIGAILAWAAAAGGGILGTAAHRESIDEDIEP